MLSPVCHAPPSGIPSGLRWAGSEMTLPVTSEAQASSRWRTYCTWLRCAALLCVSLRRLPCLETLLKWMLLQNQPLLFQQLLSKSEGERSEWEYPFAVAGINLTFMLEELLDLRKQHTGKIGHVPNTAVGRTFLELLADDSNLFERVSAALMSNAPS